MIATKKLFYENSYIFEFEATCLECRPSKQGFEVLLDSTAFYPEGGGQHGDQGFIGDSRVCDTQERDGEILHICDRPLETGSGYSCKIDRDRRLRGMREHSGEHIFSGHLHRLCNVENVGFHMGAEGVTVDFDKPLSHEELLKAELCANKTIMQNLAIECFYPSEAEKISLDFRFKKEIEGNLRLVRIEGADICACCGVHVARSGEIGLIKVVSSESCRGGTRLLLKIGEAALEDYQLKHDSLCRAGDLLSANSKTLPDAVEKLLCANTQLKQALASCQKKYCELLSDSISADEDFPLIFDEELSSRELSSLCDSLAKKCGRAAAFSGKDATGYRYFICDKGNKALDMARLINSQLNGKGGGRPEAASGSLNAKESEIRQFFSDK